MRSYVWKDISRFRLPSWGRRSLLLRVPNVIRPTLFHCMLRLHVKADCCQKSYKTRARLFTNFANILDSVVLCAPIYNANRTELSPIRSVIIRVINRKRVLLITSMITDRITCYMSSRCPLAHRAFTDCLRCFRSTAATCTSFHELQPPLFSFFLHRSLPYCSRSSLFPSSFRCPCQCNVNTN